ncbi:MAG TPA: hypothetical protein VIM11_12130 [Tepidisphaeraceae bacterium]
MTQSTKVGGLARPLNSILSAHRGGRYRKQMGSRKSPAGETYLTLGTLWRDST